MEKPAIKEVLTYKKDILLKSSSDDELHEHEYIFTRTVYNKPGKVILEEQFNALGETLQKYVYTYNEQGLLMEEKLEEADGFIAEHKTWEHDDIGRVIKEFRHYTDGSFDTIEHEYNTNGQLIKKTTIDPDGETETVEEFAWENDWLVLHVIKDSGGELLFEEKKEYNQNGKPLEVVEYVAAEDRYQRTENDYYPSGNKKEVLVYDREDHLQEKIVLIEDESGNILQVIEESRTKKNTITFTYDSQGNVVFQEEIDRNGELVGKVSREFDEHNQLLISDVFIDGGGRGMSRNYQLRQEYLYF